VRASTVCLVLSWPSWVEDAACSGLANGETDYWHPGDQRTAEAVFAYAVARRVCRDCQVRLKCVLYGLELLPLTGVEGMYGGLAPGELKELAADLERPRRVVAQHGTRAKYIGDTRTGRKGCRCGKCVRANAAYEHARRTRNGESLRCDESTARGMRCPYSAQPGSRYCGLHGGQEDAA
jgi:hypothetical protein